MILTFGDKLLTNTVSILFPRRFATTPRRHLFGKGGPQDLGCDLSNSVISPAVLGFLILFNARKMCSLRRRLEFGIFFIASSTVSKSRPS